jgi:hypothetical protein
MASSDPARITVYCSATSSVLGSFMSMRQTVLIGALAFALLSSTAPASAAHRRRAASVRCPVGAHVLAADTQAQVFVYFGGLFPEIYGCIYGHSPRLLGGTPECGGAVAGGICSGISDVVLDGTIVAYEGLGIEPAEPVHKRARPLVIVRDLRTGQTLRRLPSDVLGPDRAGPVMMIVVKSNGSVAWIVQDSGATTSQPAEYEVHAADASGERVLASGAGIDPSSLALAGSTVYWTQEGHPASAPLN